MTGPKRSVVKSVIRCTISVFLIQLPAEHAHSIFDAPLCQTNRSAKMFHPFIIKQKYAQ